jgi:hypothetical protein
VELLETHKDEFAALEALDVGEFTADGYVHRFLNKSNRKGI